MNILNFLHSQVIEYLLNFKKVALIEINKSTIVKALIPIIISIICFVNLYGWFFDINFLYLITSESTIMTYTTSILFLITVVSMIVKNRYQLIIFGIVCAFILYTVYAFLFDSQDNLFNLIQYTGNYNVKNFPSWGTIFGFFVFHFLNSFKLYQYRYILLFLVALSFVGYFSGIEILFGYIEGYSTGISVHTSIAFLHCWAWLQYESENININKKILIG